MIFYLDKMQPKGTVLVECGKMLQRGTPKLDKDGKPVRNEKGKIIYEPYKIRVCATDAGREGELIFRLVYEYAGCNKPMERLWISSMEDAAIREGFDHLRPGSDYDKLYDAAVCRAGADWLIGINATRLFSVLYGVTLNVGRVMSPTLALLVQRESDIESFISKPFMCRKSPAEVLLLPAKK